MPVFRIRLVARRGSMGRLPPYVIGSLAVHALVVAGLILAPSLKRRSPFPDNPLVVNLVAPVGPAPAARTAPAPSPPPAAEPPEGVRVETRKPEPAPKKKPAPPKKKPQPKPADPEPRPVPTETTRNPAPGEAGDGPMGPSGPADHSITALEGAGGVEFAWYRSQVTAALYSHWRKPVLQGASEPFEVRVTFDILRDGNVGNLRIDSPSGVPSLDRSALRAVTDAAPLPPLPPNWREPVLPAGFVFRLHPD